MRNSATVQSRVDVNDLHRHLLEYTRMTFCGLLYKSEPNAILVVGQGGGVIPREIRYYFPNAVIDIVEIDPDIPDIAQKYFAFSPDEKMRVHVDDGRMFIKKRLLKKHDGAYDWIILDAFNGDYIPFHLMTKEFLQEVKGILVEDGIVTANVFSSNRLFDAEWKTFLAVFKDCQVFVGSHSDNAILAASGNKGKPLDAEQAAIRADRLQNKHGFAFSLTDVAASLKPLERPDPKARVLTDDRAPVNWLKSQKRGVQ